MAGYRTDPKSGERKYISDSELARIASKQSRTYTSRAVEASKNAEDKMNQYSKLIASKTYKNPKSIDNIERLRQDAIKLYEESAEFYKKASRSENQIAKAETQSDPGRKKQTIVRRHENNALAYMKQAENSEQKKKRLMREAGQDRDEEGELEELLDGKSLFFPILAMLAFFFALISSSFSITGFLISDTTNSVANYVTLVSFIVGLIIAVIYLRKVVKDKMKEESKKNSDKKSKDDVENKKSSKKKSSNKRKAK